MTIALLIPVYNAAPFLRECLDSALAAGACVEAGGDRFEICCCDDGSTDCSLAILEAYAQAHPCLSYATQSNAGVSVTRNRLMDGLSDSVDAFAFLDSDDTVKPEMYAKLVEAMKRSGADIAECEWDGEETLVTDKSLYVLKRTSPGRWINVINKLYTRNVVGSIRFRAGLAFEEDFFFNFEVHQRMARKVIVPGRFYYYRPNPNSATSVLNQRKYFASTTLRIRLSCKEYLLTGRIPENLEAEYRAELAKDAYRMCIRKNLKKNTDASLRKELFVAAGRFFAELGRDFDFKPVGLNPIQRAIYTACLSGRYHLATMLAMLT